MKRSVAVASGPYAAYTPGAIAAGAEPRTRLFDPLDLSAKVAIVSLFTLLAVRIGADAIATGRLTGVLLLASESLVVILTVVRRSAGAVDRSWQSRLLTGVSMIGPPLLMPASVAPLLPGAVTVAISIVGLMIIIAGKLSLGRSFGLLPANRGVVSRGCYRLVRHPIYLGYLITHVAFAAANPLMWNLSLFVLSDTALLRRAVFEERTLSRDAAYRDYMSRVRWRILPRVF